MTSPSTPAPPGQPAEPTLAEALKASLTGRQHEPTRRCWCTGKFHNGRPPPAGRGAADGGDQR